jgi:quercetin dioxygenase-like cupin family protein
MIVYDKPETPERKVFQDGISHTYMCGFDVPDRLLQKPCHIDHQILYIEPGTHFVYHWHHCAFDVFTVLQGDLEADCDGDKTRLKTGDAFVPEPPEKHTIHNVGDVTGILVETRINVLNDDFQECEGNFDH